MNVGLTALCCYRPAACGVALTPRIGKQATRTTQKTRGLYRPRFRSLLSVRSNYSMIFGLCQNVDSCILLIFHLVSFILCKTQAVIAMEFESLGLLLVPAIIDYRAWLVANEQAHKDRPIVAQQDLPDRAGQ